MSLALATSSVVISKIASSTLAPAAASSRTCSSYASPLARAAAKIVGLVVTPTTFFSAMSFCRPPLLMRSRERSSSQMLTPAAESAAVGDWVVEVVSVISFFSSGARAQSDASDSFAAATACSVVIPNSRNSVL